MIEYLVNVQMMMVCPYYKHIYIYTHTEIKDEMQIQQMYMHSEFLRY